jgi:periplasmic divalent cation tolerance protein
MTDARIVLTTLDNREHAVQLANQLVELRLAACVNLIESIRSVYRWDGKVEQAEEILLIVKTAAERIPAVQETIFGLHSYQTPEFLVLPVEAASASYLEWLLASSRTSDG